MNEVTSSATLNAMKEPLTKRQIESAIIRAYKIGWTEGDNAEAYGVTESSDGRDVLETVIADLALELARVHVEQNYCRNCNRRSDI